MNTQDSRLHWAIIRCGLLTAATLVVWLLLAVPAWSIARAGGLEGLSYAALLCLVPGWLVLLASAQFGSTHDSSGLWLLGATPFRMLFVLAGALAIYQFRGASGLRGFLAWVVVFYLVTLFVETLFVVRSPSVKT